MKRVFIALTLLTLIVTAVFFLFFKAGKFWDGTSRFRLILGNEEGTLSYVLLDPKRTEIRVYTLNENTKVEAAYGLGLWKISSLWKLGEQEKKGGGQMLSQSLIRGYGLPVEGYLQYGGGVEPFNLARHLIFSTKTDLLLKDKLRLAWFVLRAKVSEQDELTPSSIIITAEELNKVTDGIVTISKTNNLSDRQSKAISLLVSNLGGKVLDFSTLQENADQYCTVMGRSIFSQKLSHVLHCEYVFSNEETTILDLGDKFAKDF